jgi:hypothetical protein
MRLSGLVVAVLFALTSFAFAQHSSAGSSGGSSSSFSSGSASHGGTSGGSCSASYSSSGRSSGGSGSHGSAAQTTRSSGSQNGLNVRLAQAGATSSRTQAEKRGFFSTLRHPFRKPTPMVEADWRRPVCKKQPCVVAPRPSLCPPGQPLNGKGVCSASNVAYRTCQAGNNGGPSTFCVYPLDDCRSLPLTLNRLDLASDEEHRKAQLERLRRESARCEGLQSLFSPHWASIYGNPLAGFP